MLQAPESHARASCLRLTRIPLRRDAARVICVTPTPTRALRSHPSQAHTSSRLLPRAPPARCQPRPSAAAPRALVSMEGLSVVRGRGAAKGAAAPGAAVPPRLRGGGRAQARSRPPRLTCTLPLSSADRFVKAPPSLAASQMLLVLVAALLLGSAASDAVSLRRPAADGMHTQRMGGMNAGRLAGWRQPTACMACSAFQYAPLWPAADYSGVHGRSGPARRARILPSRCAGTARQRHTHPGGELLWLLCSRREGVAQALAAAAGLLHGRPHTPAGAPSPPHPRPPCPPLLAGAAPPTAHGRVPRRSAH